MKKILTIIGVILFFFFLIILPFLIKVKIDCKSQYGDCPQQILDQLSTIEGKNLFYAKRGITKILKTEFLVSDYSLQFKIPNILHAELLVKKPVIAFKDVKSGSLVLVDAEGKVLSLSNGVDSALPVISVDEGLAKVGQNIGNVNLFALKLASGINQMYQVRDFSIQEGNLLVELPGQIRVILPLDGDSQILLGSLRLIYSKIQDEGNIGKYSQVDLRFTNPVLR